MRRLALVTLRSLRQRRARFDAIGLVVGDDELVRRGIAIEQVDGAGDEADGAIAFGIGREHYRELARDDVRVERGEACEQRSLLESREHFERARARLT